MNSNNARHTIRPTPLIHKRIKRGVGFGNVQHDDRRDPPSDLPRTASNASQRNSRRDTPRVVRQPGATLRKARQHKALQSPPRPELLGPIARIAAVLPFFGKGELDGLAEYLEAELSARLMKSRRR